MNLAPFKDLIDQLVSGYDLDEEQSIRAFQIMMGGGATPAQIAAFLVAMRIKGETVTEITGAARTMRHKALAFTAPEGAIDTCGTGGDASGSYNISTATAIVTAACGIPVVKHGNRSVSSRSGSADVMKELGVNLQASTETMERALAECNLCFLMAPAYHKAMRHVGPVRQELGMRTIFNLLGPLSNPAGVSRQLLGVYSPRLLQPLAEVLVELEIESAWVVHGHGGLDEISLTGNTQVVRVENGKIDSFEVDPAEANLRLCDPADLRGGDAATNARALEAVLAGRASPYRDIVCLNAAACLVLSHIAEDLAEGALIARKAIDSGDARDSLNTLIRITNEEGSEDDDS
jgi:anthranilate phosphoribosyltransferase